LPDNRLLEREIEITVARALEEDLDEAGDVTSKATIAPGLPIRAEMLAKSPGVIAGLTVAQETFAYLDPAIEFNALVEDGTAVEAGTRIAEVSGDALAVLAGERTALNFVQHLSGIATEVAKYTKILEGTGVELLDTRKTTPGLRHLEKYAARVGGARNHRFGLYDQVLIKDNHISVAGDIKKAVQRARDAYPELIVEVEVETLDEVAVAVQAGADIILLDNMDTELLKASVKLIGNRAITEASGGVTLATIADIAATGVDRVSVGALTQAAKPLDISLEIIG